MAKGYKTVTGLLRHGLGMPEAAKDVAKLIKASVYKCKSYKHYEVKFFNNGTWYNVSKLCSNTLIKFPTLKEARKIFNMYKKEYPSCVIVKVVESEEVVADSKVHHG